MISLGLSSAIIKPQPGSQLSAFSSWSTGGRATGVNSLGYLAGFWPLWEGAGSKALSAFDKRPGTINSATWTRGLFGPALTFATTQNVDLGTDGIFNDSTVTISYSILAWVKASSFPAVGMIFSLAASGTNALVGLYIDSSGRVNFEATNGAGTDDAIHATGGLSPLSTNRWYQLVLTSDGTRWRVYVNAIEQTTITVLAGSNSGGGWNRATGATSSFRIGSDFHSRVSFTGTIDHIRAYRRCLQPSEIWALYVAPFADFQHTNVARFVAGLPVSVSASSRSSWLLMQ